MIFYLLLPTLATSFSPSHRPHIMTQSLPRRTSSIAHDTNINDFYNHAARRERWHSFLSSSTSSDTANTNSLNNENKSNRDGSNKPLFTFGILTDIQYAPIPNGTSYNGTPRYYRHALSAAKYAASHFEEEKVQVVLNLGDIIDGKCGDVRRFGGEDDGGNVGGRAVEEVLEALSGYTNGKILHTYGNHELYNLSREELGQKLQIPFTLEPSGDLVGYYTHSIDSHLDNCNNLYPEMQQDPDATTSNNNNYNKQASKLRFLILDSYDISILDRCPNQSPKHKNAQSILSTYNPNYPHNENSPEGLSGLSKRYVAFGGGIDTPQLQWLQTCLQSSQDKNERVIILSHQPIHPDSSYPVCLMWNYSEVLTILRQYSHIILASFAGHAHKGGYIRDECGIHFRTLEAVLESPDPIRTYGIVDVWEDCLVVRGEGDCASDVFVLDHLR